jgi:hypothetical protein
MKGGARQGAGRKKGSGQASTFVDKVKGMDVPDGYYDMDADDLTDLLSKNAESLTRH